MAPPWPHSQSSIPVFVWSPRAGHRAPAGVSLTPITPIITNYSHTSCLPESRLIFSNPCSTKLLCVITVYIPLDIPSLMGKLLETEVNILGWRRLGFSSNNYSVCFPVLLAGWCMRGGWGETTFSLSLEELL